MGKGAHHGDCATAKQGVGRSVRACRMESVPGNPVAVASRGATRGLVHYPRVPHRWNSPGGGARGISGPTSIGDLTRSHCLYLRAVPASPVVRLESVPGVKFWWSFGCAAGVLTCLGGCLSSAGGSGESCPEGRERCECYPNDTCDRGLSCRSGLCVDAEMSGSDEDSGSTSDTDGATDEEASDRKGSDSGAAATDGGPTAGGADEDTDAKRDATDVEPTDTSEATGDENIDATDGGGVPETDTAQTDMAVTDGAATDVAVTDSATADQITDNVETDVAVTDEPVQSGYVEVELISSCSGPRGENFDGAWFAGAGPDSSITPEDSSGTFSMTSGGYSGTSARVVGTVAPGDYAHVGHVMYRGSALFDASDYDGISFYAKAGAAIDVRVELAQENSDPFYGLCVEDVSCYNNPALTVAVGTEWTRYVVPFAALTTNPDLPLLAVTPGTIKHWQFAMPVGDFDFWLDDLYFVQATSP